MEKMMQKMVSVTSRRLNLVLFIVLGYAFAGATAAYAQSTPVGLVGYWKLDDSNSNYVDQVNAPSGHDGICDTSCPTQLDQSLSVIGQAQQFDGGSEGISVPAASAFDWSATQSFSIELWVKKNTAVASGGEVLVARKDPNSQLAWKIELKQNGTASFSLVSTGGQGASSSANGSKVINKDNNDRWHHIVAMRDATHHINAIYVDGQLDGASSAVTYTSGFDSASAGPTMGWIDAVQQERFGGSLDEVAFYSRALSDTEIATHYYLAKGYYDTYDAKTRILPLGDSITLGYPGSGTSDPVDPNPDGYRLSLWNGLAGNSYYMDFVGSEHDATGDIDPDHAGYGGLSTAGLFEIMSIGNNPDNDALGRYPGRVTTSGPLLDTYPADVVLLHIGTNDLNSSFDSQSVTHVANVLDQIDAKSENITVILALIINRAPGGNQSATDQYNTALLAMADDRIDHGDKIIVLDMEHDAGLNYTIGADFNDELHPNTAGYAKMGAAWLSELELFMPQFAAPQIHAAANPPVATLGRPFEFTVPFDGAPTPSFSLTAKPSTTMTIEPSTGMVSWTPSLQTTGPISFTVKAVNSIPTGTATLSLTSKSDTHTFNVALNHAPTAAADAYTTAADGSLNVGPAAGVLANDTDADSDPLTAKLVSTAAHGTLALNSDGSFTYTSDGSGATTDAFTYQADDGNAASAATTVALSISQSSNNGGGGGGGSGGGCFIGAIGAPASTGRPWTAWSALAILFLAVNLILKEGRGRRRRTGCRAV
jgi:VCBS repeat-containing protein